MKHVLLSLTVLFAMSTNAAGATPTTDGPLVGTWLLVKSDNPLPNGQIVPYCTGAHGMVIYTHDGYVSVALNCGEQTEPEEPANISGRKFFYSGTYEFDGAQVRHTLLNASQPELIGTSFIRDVKLEDKRLILTGVNQGQQFSAHWMRVE